MQRPGSGASDGHVTCGGSQLRIRAPCHSEATLAHSLGLSWRPLASFVACRVSQVTIGGYTQMPLRCIDGKCLRVLNKGKSNWYSKNNPGTVKIGGKCYHHGECRYRTAATSEPLWSDQCQA